MIKYILSFLILIFGLAADCKTPAELASGVKEWSVKDHVELLARKYPSGDIHYGKIHRDSSNPLYVVRRHCCERVFVWVEKYSVGQPVIKHADNLFPRYVFGAYFPDLSTWENNAVQAIVASVDNPRLVEIYTNFLHQYYIFHKTHPIVIGVEQTQESGKFNEIFGNQPKEMALICGNAQYNSAVGGLICDEGILNTEKK
jgi:hypothetical protein